MFNSVVSMIINILITEDFLKEILFERNFYFMLYRCIKYIEQMNVALAFALATSLVFTSVKGMLVLAQLTVLPSFSNYI